MLSPETLIDSAGSGLGAGPATTSPVVMLYWLPWHGQSMVPLLIWLTIHPMCVQTALNALYSPAVGWVTTTFGPGKIIPLPTGIWLVAASAFAAGALLAAALLPAAAALLAGALPAAAGVVAGTAAGALLDELAPQAVIAPARPTRPTPASTPRRVASESVCGSCVTSAPVRVGTAYPYRGTKRGAVWFTAGGTRLEIGCDLGHLSCAAPTVAERNEEGLIIVSPERDFGQPERVQASNSPNELVIWG
jgi:hypothetical protein